MNKNNSFEEIWEALKTCKRIAMTLHVSPDGDSLGSCCAIKYALEKNLGCEVTVVSSDPLDSNITELSFTKEVQMGKDIADLDHNDFDAYIFIDTGSPGRLSHRLLENYKIPDMLTINIDHHYTNNNYGKLNYVDPHKISSCSLLLEMFQKLEIDIDSELANRLILGISTDSGFFSHSQNALKEAAYLIDKGANYLELVKALRMSTPLKLKKFYAKIIDNIVERDGFGYSVISQKDMTDLNLNEAEIRFEVSAIDDIKEFEFVFTVIEFSDKIKGSFRSRKNVDVSLFATALGGGGHKPAAAYVLPKMQLDEAVEKVLGVIEQVGIHRY